MNEQEKSEFNKKVKELEFHVSNGNVHEILELLSQGVKIHNEACLDSIVSKKECVSVLRALEDNGYDLNQRGNILLFKTALSLKLKNSMFLFSKLIEKNSFCAKLTLTNLHEKFKTDPDKCKPIVDLFVHNVNETLIREIIENTKGDEYKQYLYVSWLQAHLPANNTQSPKLKI